MSEEDLKWTIAVDFDKTLTRNEGYNPYPEFGEEVPDQEIIEWVNEMSEHHKIVIHTARTEDMEEPTREWLDNYGVEYDELFLEKPAAIMYVDDKAVRPGEIKRWRRDSNNKSLFGRLLGKLLGDKD